MKFFCGNLKEIYFNNQITYLLLERELADIISDSHFIVSFLEIPLI